MRVLVVRPEADARRTAARLAERGHEALVAPVLRIEATGAPPPQSSFDAVAVTSANAVPALASIRERVVGAPLFAVGRRTAEALAKAGLPTAHVAPGDGASLADLVAATVGPGGTVLHVAGRDRKGEPAASLERRGCRVVVWTAYAAVAVASLPDAARRALEEGALDAALQYSRRSAETLLTLAADAGCFVALLSLRHACLSQDAAAPLHSAGARRLIVAARPDEDSLFQALDSAGG
jgi:uroporphyrinogen-III synthase